MYIYVYRLFYMLNSEQSIDNCSFTIKIGTTDRKNPKSVYFFGRAFVCPLYDKSNYDQEIHEIMYNFKHRLYDKLNASEIFDKKCITKMEIPVSRMKKGKRSSLTFEMYLKQKDGNIKPFKIVKEESKPFIDGVVFDLLNDVNMHNFELYKTKNK